MLLGVLECVEKLLKGILCEVPLECRAESGLFQTPQLIQSQLDELAIDNMARVRQTELVQEPLERVHLSDLTDGHLVFGVDGSLKVGREDRVSPDSTGACSAILLPLRRAAMVLTTVQAHLPVNQLVH